MRRKLIQHGLSSLTVSLPRKWVVENNLEKGGEVDVEESRGTIVIATEKHYAPKMVEVDVTNAQPMIRRIIGATFKSGYDEVFVRFGSFEELKAVQELMREQFSGFEIVHQTKNSITIKNVSRPSFEEFNQVLRRFFFVLQQMASDSAAAIEKNDLVWLKNTTLMKIESDKCADYCRRAINMGCESAFKRITPVYTIVEQLEKAADRYKDLCDHIVSNDLKVNDDIKSFIKRLVEFQESFHALMFKFGIEKMVDFGRKKATLQKELDALAQDCSKKERKVVTLLDRILNLTFDLNGPLMAVHI